MMLMLTTSVVNTFQPSSGSTCLYLPLSSLHSLAFFVAVGHITPEALLTGQQCQAETFYGFIPRHRYWPDLLLIFRFVLLLEFALNPQQDPNINLLAILLGAEMWDWVNGGVYKNWCLDALEDSYVLNLITLGAATYYVNSSKFSVGYMSVTSSCYIHCNPHLPYLLEIEAHKAVEEGA